MAKRTERTEAVLDVAIEMISKGRTYAEAAVRTKIPYWLISGSIRKIAVPVLYEEKDRIEAYAQTLGSTAPQVIMDLVNMYWDDYVKRTSRRKKGRKAAAA